jgi:hypothetical protein
MGDGFDIIGNRLEVFFSKPRAAFSLKGRVIHRGMLP